jgi:hypothetical protein
MPIWSPAFFGSGAGSSGFVVEDSIWLDGSADELTFTPSQDGTGAGKKYTLSFWTKIIDTESTGSFFCAGQSGGDSLHIQTDWSSGNPFLNFNDSSGGSSNWLRRTGTRVLRDPTAWMHICFAVDNSSGGGLAGTANAARVYINGAEDTSFTTANSNPPSSDTSRMTMQYEHVIGNGAGFNDFKSFYLAEFVIVDGQQLTPASFGEYDDNGVWIPINVSGLTFGNNGCYLNFKVAPGTGNGAGTDVSGNNNHFTDVSLTAAQQVTDTCTDDADNNIGNYPTWSPIDKDSNVTVSSGNTVAEQDSTASFKSVFATQVVPSTGKWVWEIKQTVSSFVGDGYATTGVASTNVARSIGRSGSGSITFDYQSGTSKIRKFGGGDSDYATSVSLTNTNFTIQFAVDSDAEELKLFVSNSQVGTTLDISSLTKPYKIISQIYTGGNVDHTLVTNSADFVNNVPSGYKTINTANLPAPTVTKPDDYFGTLLYTGNDTARTIKESESGVEGTSFTWTPDFVWIKSRVNPSAGNFHHIYDVVRGGSAGALYPNSNDVEDEFENGFNDFVAGGFSTTNTDSFFLNSNDNSATYVAWCMKAGGAVSAGNNTTGSIATTVSAADHGGFSIATWTGNGSAGATIGHGLSRKPVMGIFRRKSLAQDWAVYHEGLDPSAPEDKFINLNGTGTNLSVQDATWLNDTPPSASIWTLGTSGYVNTSSETFVAYSFARTPGLIGAGTFEGVASTDGANVIINDGGSGFKPAFLIIKSIDAQRYWVMHDGTRNPYNPASLRLHPNTNESENVSGTAAIDFLANGFKLRNTSSHSGGSAETYIYLAFAEHPFGGDTVAQAKAR